MQNSAKAFLCFCAAGILPGLLFDGFRLIRYFIPHHRAAVIVEDVFWGIGTFFVSFFCVIAYAGGVVRWFFLFGMFMGCVLYFLLLSPIVLRILKAAIGFLIRIVRILFHPLYLLFAFVWRKLRRVCFRLKVFFRKRRNSLENTK